MEMVMPKAPNQSERTNSECKNPSFVKETYQKPQISSLHMPQNDIFDCVKVPKSPFQSGEVDSDCKIDLEMPKNGTPDHLLVPKSPNQRGEMSSGCKTPILVKETEEKLGVLVLEMPENGTPDCPDQSGNVNSECKATTPVKQTVQKSQTSSIEFPKNGTPDRLKVPKAFKYPERYNSPTDLMMSPITRGLLSRGRKGGVLLPPSKNQLKMHDFRVPEMSLLS